MTTVYGVQKGCAFVRVHDAREEPESDRDDEGADAGAQHPRIISGKVQNENEMWADS